MKTADLWARYHLYNRDVNEQGRKLAFGGIAICWITRPMSGALSTGLLGALFLFAIFLLLDLLHPFVGALVLKSFTEKSEEELARKTGSEEGNVEKPKWVDRPAFTLYVSKVIILVLALLSTAWAALERFPLS